MLKKRPLFLASVVLLALLAAGGIWFFLLRSKKGGFEAPTTGSAQNELSQQGAGPQANSPIYENEDFSINIPEGFTTSPQPLSGTLATFVNANEQHGDDPPAAKINFKSYVAVGFDNLQGRDLTGVVEFLKTQVAGSLPGAVVTPEGGFVTKDNLPGKVFELEFAQQDTSFHVALFTVLSGDKFYTISANTTAKKWFAYKASFYETAKSIIFKK